MCEDHPTVRHALIPIGALHRRFEEVETKQIDDRGSLLALTHSAKAITCLQGDLIQEQPSRFHREIVLVTCVIWINASSIPRRCLCRPLPFSIWV
jgi:hypothetical protein